MGSSFHFGRWKVGRVDCFRQSRDEAWIIGFAKPFGDGFMIGLSGIEEEILAFSKERNELGGGEEELLGSEIPKIDHVTM